MKYRRSQSRSQSEAMRRDYWQNAALCRFSVSFLYRQQRLTDILCSAFMFPVELKVPLCLTNPVLSAACLSVPSTIPVPSAGWICGGWWWVTGVTESASESTLTHDFNDQTATVSLYNLFPWCISVQDVEVTGGTTVSVWDISISDFLDATTACFESFPVKPSVFVFVSVTDSSCHFIRTLLFVIVCRRRETPLLFVLRAECGVSKSSECWGVEIASEGKEVC